MSNDNSLKKKKKKNTYTNQSHNYIYFFTFRKNVIRNMVPTIFFALWPLLKLPFLHHFKQQYSLLPNKPRFDYEWWFWAEKMVILGLQFGFDQGRWFWADLSPTVATSSKAT